MTSMILVALMQISALGAEQGTFEQAYHRSLVTGRPLVVLIGATWCRGCQTMKNSILPQVEEAGGLDRVVFVYVDLDQQRQLATRLKRATSIPQLIRFDRTTTGWKTKCLVGAKSPREVYDFINAGLIEGPRTSEVSTTTRSKKNSRKPVAREISTSKKDTSRSSTTASANTPRFHKREAPPTLAETVDGPSEWKPLYNTTTPGNKKQDSNTAYRGDQVNTKRR